MEVKLKYYTPLSLISEGIRTCWNSQDKSDNGGKKDRELVDRVSNKFKHKSVLRHSLLVFDITASTKTLLAFTRHKAGVDFSVQCVIGDTEITTSNGKRPIQGLYKAQENYKSLPKVRVYDEDTKAFKFVNVLEVFSNGEQQVYEITTESGRKIECTNEHKFLSDDEWIPLKKLKVGSTIYTLYSLKKRILTIKPDKIKSIKYIGVKETFDLEVDHKSHNYVANGIVTHNSSRFTTKKVLKNEAPFTYTEEGLELITEEMWERSKQFLLHTGKDEIDTFNIRQLESARKACKAGYSNDDISLLLPQAWLYKFQVSMNVQSLQHLFALRISKGAHWDIQNMAIEMYKSLPEEYKYLFDIDQDILDKSMRMDENE